MPRDLVIRAMGGDHEAFSLLAGASIDRLFAVARLILRETELAEDAVQETLVVAWRDLSGLRDPDRFDPWLHRLLVRACYRESKRNRRVGHLEIQITSIELGQADETRAIADRDQLERGFRRLNPEQRTILVLHFYSGLPLPEVAEAMGIPLGTAKSRLHRAIDAMRAGLDADARLVLAHAGPVE